MSLDIAILDKDNIPVDSVQIGVDDHYILMQFINHEELPLLHRMKDYYSDATYLSFELHDLYKESQLLIERLASKPDVVSIIKNICKLIEYAMCNKMKICALSD